MRVTGNTIVAGLAGQLNLLAARQARLQQQVATGQRIAVPEDDPAGVRRALQLQDRAGRVAQFSRNIATLQNRTAIAFSALDQVKRISDRAGEIATLADGTRSPEELRAFATELGQLIEQAAQLANSRDETQYLFGGSATGRPPFSVEKTPEGQVTRVVYLGNAASVETEIAEGASLAAGVPGQNSTGAGPRGLFADSRSGADFFNHLLALRDHLLAGDTAAIAAGDRQALAADEENFIYHAAGHGVVQARLDLAAASAQDQATGEQQALEDVLGADVSFTLVQLAQAQNAYQLAAQSSAKLLQLQQTLLSYLP